MFNWLRAKLGAPQQTLTLISNWLAGQLWNIEARFLALARQAFGENEVVFSCLRLLSQSVPEPPLVAYTGTGDQRKPLPDEHELMRLIRQPNELMTEYEFWELTTLHMAIIGRSTWWKERANNGQTIALWPLRPDRAGPIYSTSDRPGERVLAGWSYLQPGANTPVALSRRDVLTFNFPDPGGESGGIVEGLGPVMALARMIASDNEATKFVGSLLANYAAPTVALKVKATIPDQDTAQLIKAKFRQEFGGAQRGTPALLDADTEVELLGFNLQQLEFPEIRKISESRISAALGVPAMLVGLQAGLAASTYSNYQEARRYFAETTLANYWRRFSDQYTNDLAAEFGEGIVCEFDTSKVKALAGQAIEQAAPVKDAFTAGAATVNEYRAAIHLEPLEPEFGDVFLRAATLTAVPATAEVQGLSDQRAAEQQEQQRALVDAQQKLADAQRPALLPPGKPEPGEELEEGEEAPAGLRTGGHAGHRGQHAGHGGGHPEEEKIRHATTEQGVILSAKGDFVGAIAAESGGDRSLSISSADAAKMKGGTFSHNHPRDASFSGGDLLVAQRAQVATLRVVSSGHTYELSADSPKDWKRAANSYPSVYAKLANKNLESVRLGKRTVEEANAEHDHEVITEVARRTGLRYSRTALND